MAHNALDPTILKQLCTRIASVTPDSRAQWGVMNSHQMLLHLRDSLEVLLGRRKASDPGYPALFRTAFFKWLGLYVVPISKGKVKTAPEIDQVRGNGQASKPVDFAADQQALLALMEEFGSMDKAKLSDWHPIFGKFTPKDWGRQVYIHTDHHLRQFGC